MRGTTTWWLWVGAMGLAVSPAGAAVSVTFEPAAVVASGISPSQQVVVFGVAREPTAFSVRVVSRIEVITDEDGDGNPSWRCPNARGWRCCLCGRV